MKCPKCNTESRIGGSRYVLKDEKLFLEQTFYCRNKNCANNGESVGVVNTPLEYTSETSPKDE